MSDSLSHSCPTCGGTGWADKGELVAKVRAAKTGMRVAVAGAECPDCIDGYPKAAVERAAKAIYDSELPTADYDKMGRQVPFEESMSPWNFIIGALAAIRAFHDEGSER